MTDERPKHTYKGDVMLYVTLSECLNKLRAQEGEKEYHERRQVPSLTEIADSIGMHRVTITNLANNNISNVSRKTMAAVVNELRRRGFVVNAGDVFTFFPANQQGRKSE